MGFGADKLVLTACNSGRLEWDRYGALVGDGAARGVASPQLLEAPPFPTNWVRTRGRPSIPRLCFCLAPPCRHTRALQTAPQAAVKH